MGDRKSSEIFMMRMAYHMSVNYTVYVYATLIKYKCIYVFTRLLIYNRISRKQCTKERLGNVCAVNLLLLEWTTRLDTSSRTLFVREGGREDVSPDAHVTSNVELRNNVRLLLNLELRNYVISRQIVEHRVT